MSMGKDSILWRITKNPPPNLGLGSLSKEENVRAESREESSECCHLDMTIALTMQLYNLFVLLVGCFSWLLHEFFLDSFCFFNLSPTNVFCSLAQFLLGQLSSLFSLLAQSTFNCLFNSAPSLFSSSLALSIFLPESTVFSNPTFLSPGTYLCLLYSPVLQFSPLLLSLSLLYFSQPLLAFYILFCSWKFKS